MLLKDIPGPEVAMRVAHRISKSLGTKFELSSETAELRASAGVALRGPETPTLTAEELVKLADTAMYSSKDQGLGLPVLATGLQETAAPKNR